jgi:hypothetical protein
MLDDDLEGFQNLFGCELHDFAVEVDDPNHLLSF